MKPALANEDLLWGMLCLVQQRRFPMRLLVEFWWMRRGSVCGAKERFGTSRRRVELDLTHSLAFGEIGGVTIADMDPGEQMVTLSGGGIAMRRQRLELDGVYGAHGDALQALADEFDAYVMSQAGNPDVGAVDWWHTTPEAEASGVHHTQFFNTGISARCFS